MGGLTQIRFLKLRPVFRKPRHGEGDCPDRQHALPDRLQEPAPTACKNGVPEAAFDAKEKKAGARRASLAATLCFS